MYVWAWRDACFYIYAHTYVHTCICKHTRATYVRMSNAWLIVLYTFVLMYACDIDWNTLCLLIYIYIYIYIYNMYVCVYIHTWGWAFCRRIVEEQYSKKLSQIKFSENCDQTMAWEAWVLLYTFTWLAWAQLSPVMLHRLFWPLWRESSTKLAELRSCSLHLQASVRPYAVRLLRTPTTWNHVHLR